MPNSLETGRIWLFATKEGLTLLKAYRARGISDCRGVSCRAGPCG